MKLTITVGDKTITYKKGDIVNYMDSHNNRRRGIIEEVMPNYVIVMNGTNPIIIHKSSLIEYLTT